MLKKVMYMSVFIAFAAILAMASYAQSDEGGTSWQDIFAADFTYEDILNSKVSVQGGVLFQFIGGDGKLDPADNVDANNNPVSNNIDLDDDLGVDDEINFFVRLEYQPWEKHHFRFEYKGVDFDGSNRLSNTFWVDDDRFDAGDPVKVDASADFYTIGYRYDLLRGENYVVAPLIDLVIVDFEGEIRSDARQVWDPVIGWYPHTPLETTDGVIPIPCIGFHGEYFFHPRFGVVGEISGMSIGVASKFGVEAAAQVNVHRNFSILSGLRYDYFNYDDDGDDFDVDIWGPFISAQIQF